MARKSVTVPVKRLPSESKRGARGVEEGGEETDEEIAQGRED